MSDRRPGTRCRVGGSSRAPRAARRAGAGARARAPEGLVRRRGEALLVGAQRQQRGDAVAGGQQRVVHAHAEAVHAHATRAAGGGARFPHEQRARGPTSVEPAALRHRPCGGAGRRVVAHEVAEQPSACSAAPARGRAWAHDVRPALGVQLGDDPGVGHAGQRDSDGSSASRSAAVPRNGVARDRRQGPDRAEPLEPARRRRQWTSASSGRLDGHGRWPAGQPPAIGRRRITSSAPTGSSRTCSACPAPVVTIPK